MTLKLLSLGAQEMGHHSGVSVARGGGQKLHFIHRYYSGVDAPEIRVGAGEVRWRWVLGGWRPEMMVESRSRSSKQEA